MGCFRTCDIFTRHSGVLTGGSVAATFYRVLHVMECPQDMGRQGRVKCVKMMHTTEKRNMHSDGESYLRKLPSE